MPHHNKKGSLQEKHGKKSKPLTRPLVKPLVKPLDFKCSSKEIGAYCCCIGDEKLASLKCGPMIRRLVAFLLIMMCILAFLFLAKMCEFVGTLPHYVAPEPNSVKPLSWLREAFFETRLE